MAAAIRRRPLKLGRSSRPQVVKEIVLSDNLLIEQSEQLRRMDVGEVMEVFQGSKQARGGRAYVFLDLCSTAS